MQQFKTAVKAITSRTPAPEPEPQRRRRTDETRGAFSLAATKLFRRPRQIPSALFAATAYLWDTLDWMNMWQQQDAVATEDLEQQFHSSDHDQLYPHL